MGYRSYVKLRVISPARRCRGREAPAPLSPKPPLLRRVRRTGMVQGGYFFRRCAAPTELCRRSSLITAPPGDSLRLISGGLTARVSLHSRRHESARPLRNTATAYFVPTLRARREAPSLVPGSGVGLLIFQPASALSTGQYKWAVSKQRKPPQTANRLDGRHAPVAAAQEKGSFSLWTKHYRQCGLVGCRRLVPGAAHQLSP